MTLKQYNILQASLFSEYRIKCNTAYFCELCEELSYIRNDNISIAIIEAIEILENIKNKYQ